MLATHQVSPRSPSTTSGRVGQGLLASIAADDDLIVDDVGLGPDVAGTGAATAWSSPATASRIAGPYERYFKRPFDVIVGSVALVCAAPVLAAVAIAVRIRFGKEIIFRQSRVGLGGRDFEMWKFHTMLASLRVQQAEFDGPDRRHTHKSALDPRHTKFGRFLRKTSLDELPQLVHVVRGEMSLVGPRPEISSVVDKHGLRDHPRHTVRPGLTGLWQITHRSEGTLLHESMDDDLIYLEQISLRTDLSILVRTVRVVLKAEGS